MMYLYRQRYISRVIRFVIRFIDLEVNYGYFVKLYTQNRSCSKITK